MEIKNIDDCFKYRLLRNISPDPRKAKRSIELSEETLKEANSLFKFKLFNYIILNSYMAMFHSARALLYQDGIQEKSHFALYIYLKEKYKDKISLSIINLLNIYRVERHEAMYGFEYKPQENDALIAFKDAKLFVGKIKEIL